jgi:hypothetical protein
MDRSFAQLARLGLSYRSYFRSTVLSRKIARSAALTAEYVIDSPVLALLVLL